MRPNQWAVAAAVVAGAVVSSIWYSTPLFGWLGMELQDAAPRGAVDASMPEWKVIVDLVRAFGVVSVLGRFVQLRGSVHWKDTLRIWFWAWLGLKVARLVGASVRHDKPWLLGVAHVGVWLVKLLVMAVVVDGWPDSLCSGVNDELER